MCDFYVHAFTRSHAHTFTHSHIHTFTHSLFMEFLSSTAQIAWAVLLVILGLNALIIVHEFGHFIVARWCGVRCDKFYIWFDLFGYRLCRFRWGDTEYGIGWAPLGGYVKMFGQEDNPGEARAEIERAKLAATQAEEALEHGDHISRLINRLVRECVSKPVSDRRCKIL